MPGRKSLADTLWLFSLLALLAWVLVAPNRKLGLATALSRPDLRLANFARPRAEPIARLGEGTADDALPGANFLAWEDEEQDRVEVLNEPRASFLITCSFRKVSARRALSPRLFLSTYPIRC